MMMKEKEQEKEEDEKKREKKQMAKFKGQFKELSKKKKKKREERKSKWQLQALNNSQLLTNPLFLTSYSLSLYRIITELHQQYRWKIYSTGSLQI